MTRDEAITAINSLTEPFERAAIQIREMEVAVEQAKAEDEDFPATILAIWSMTGILLRNHVHILKGLIAIGALLAEGAQAAIPMSNACRFCAREAPDGIETEVGWAHAQCYGKKMAGMFTNE